MIERLQVISQRLVRRKVERQVRPDADQRRFQTAVQAFRAFIAQNLHERVGDAVVMLDRRLRGEARANQIQGIRQRARDAARAPAREQALREPPLKRPHRWVAVLVEV